jgi:hypothetical protein
MIRRDISVRRRRRFSRQPPAAADDPCPAASGPAIRRAAPRLADSGEIELALKVAPARQDLGRHWVKHRLEADAVAGVELVALRRDMHAYTARLVARIDVGQRICLDDDAPAFLHLIDIDDPPGNGDRPEMALQHRRLPLPGGLPHQCKTGGQGGERNRGFAPARMPA